jgi:hypothetical protein
MKTQILSLVILLFITFSSYAAYLSASEKVPISYQVETSIDHVISKLYQKTASFEVINAPESWPHIVFLSAPGLLLIGLYLTTKKSVTSLIW